MSKRTIQVAKIAAAFLAVVFGVTVAVRGIHNADTFTDQLSFGIGAALALLVYLFLNRDSA